MPAGENALSGLTHPLAVNILYKIRHRNRYLVLWKYGFNQQYCDSSGNYALTISKISTLMSNRGDLPLSSPTEVFTGELYFQNPLDIIILLHTGTFS